MSVIIHDPENNNILHMDSIWAFISTDEHGEGLCAAPLGDVMVPLLASDEARVNSLMPIAEMLARNSTKKITLVKFTTREEICVLQPGWGRKTQ